MNARTSSGSALCGPGSLLKCASNIIIIEKILLLLVVAASMHVIV